MLLFLYSWSMQCFSFSLSGQAEETFLLWQISLDFKYVKVLTRCKAVLQYFVFSAVSERIRSLLLLVLYQFGDEISLRLSKIIATKTSIKIQRQNLSKTKFLSKTNLNSPCLFPVEADKNKVKENPAWLLQFWLLWDRVIFFTVTGTGLCFEFWV